MKVLISVDLEGITAALLYKARESSLCATISHKEDFSDSYFV